MHLPHTPLLLVLCVPTVLHVLGFTHNSIFVQTKIKTIPQNRVAARGNIAHCHHTRTFDAKLESKCNGISRRDCILKSFGSFLVACSTKVSPAHSAETVGKDPDCNDASCLGVWDGLLADCPHGNRFVGVGAGCASSQDDTPGVFAEPWDYAEAPNNTLEWQDQMKLLKPTIELVSTRRGDTIETLFQSGRYLRVLFTDAKSGEVSVGEFYFTPNDTTVQFRVASIPVNSSNNNGINRETSFRDKKKLFAAGPSMKNLERCEMIRKEMRYDKVPVLRNRKRTLFVVESELDTFGPGSAALGPPAEMSSGDLEGRQESVDPKLKTDVLQFFPVQR